MHMWSLWRLRQWDSWVARIACWANSQLTRYPVLVSRTIKQSQGGCLLKKQQWRLSSGLCTQIPACAWTLTHMWIHICAVHVYTNSEKRVSSSALTLFAWVNWVSSWAIATYASRARCWRMIHLPESITVWDLRADQSLLWKRVRLWWGNCKEFWVQGKPDFRSCLTYGAMQLGAIRDTDLWTSVLYSLPNLLWHWLRMSNFRAVCSRNASLKDVHTHQCQSWCGQQTFFL